MNVTVERIVNIHTTKEESRREADLQVRSGRNPLGTVIHRLSNLAGCINKVNASAEQSAGSVMMTPMLPPKLTHWYSIEYHRVARAANRISLNRKYAN